MAEVDIFQFASPAWLWLLSAVVLIPLLYGGLRLYARKKLRRLGNIRTLTTLMPDSSPARGWVKIAFLSLAVGFIALALARPQMGSKLRSAETEGREIVLVVDVSNSMLADDVSPSRMERTRYAISRLLESMKDDRVGVVAFADEAEVLLPITGDYKMARSMVRRLSPTLIARQGTNIGNALDVALLSFTESTHNKNSRVIILITDGEAHDVDTEAAIERAKADGVMICAIGIGTPEGVPLSINGTIMEDEDGKMVVTKLGEALLQHIADETEGVYMRSRNDAFGLDEVVGYLDELEATKLLNITFEEYDEQYQWFLGAALLMLVAKSLIFRRKNPMLKGVTLFERETKTINRKKQ